MVIWDPLGHDDAGSGEPEQGEASVAEVEHLTQLFARHPPEARQIEDLAYDLLTARGERLGDRLFPAHGRSLAPVLRTREDLRQFLAVLRDAYRAVEQCGTYDMPVSVDILERFVQAKAGYAAELEALLPAAPGLRRRLLARPRLAVRVVCVEDDNLRGAITASASLLEVLVESDEDAAALVELLSWVAGNHNLDAWQVMAALPQIKAIIEAASSAELFRFLVALIKKEEYLHSIDSPEWLREFAAYRHTFAANRFDSHRWMARLHEYASIVKHAAPWLTSERNAARIEQAFAAIYGQSYGYSDRDHDLKGMIPAVIAICAPLATSLDGFLRLCAAVPAILRALPEDSEETPVGYIHSYDTSDLEAQARAATSLDAFLAGLDLGT